VGLQQRESSHIFFGYKKSQPLGELREESKEVRERDKNLDEDLNSNRLNLLGDRFSTVGSVRPLPKGNL
jgi:hypothetical protein